MNKVSAIFDKIDEAIFTGAQIAAFIMMLLTTADATMRYVFNQPIVGAYEFSESYLMVIIVFLSISYVMKLDGHIRIDLITEHLPQKLVKILDMIYMLIAACLMFAIGYQGMLMTEEAWVNHYTAAGLIPWPTWLSVIWVPIGGYLFTIRLLLQFVLSLLNSNQTHPNEKKDEDSILV